MALELTIDDLYHEMRRLYISSSLAIAGSSPMAIVRRLVARMMMNMTDQRGCKKRSLDHDLYVSSYKLGYTLGACSGDHRRQLNNNQLLVISELEAPSSSFADRASAW